MYDLFFSSGTGHSLMVLAFTIALGLLLGKIKIKGVSLGAIWVLFVGILFGALGVKADSLFLHFLKEFGLILFVFSIGLQVGPGFFHSFRRQGLRLNLLAMLLVLVSAGCLLLVHSFSVGDFPSLVGVMTGSMTNTPGLGTAQQTYYDTVYGTFLAEVDYPAVSSQMANAFAVAYPFGILGVVLVIVLLRFLFRVNLTEERRALEEPDGAQVLSRVFAVRNPGVIGKHLSEVKAQFEGDFAVVSLTRGETVIPVAGDPVLEEGDRIAADLSARDEQLVRILFGHESAKEKTPQLSGNLIGSIVTVTKPSLTGRRLHTLHALDQYGVTVTRVVRAGVSLVARDHFRLQMGDSLRVIGTEADIARFAECVGNSSRALEKPNLIPIFFGIGLGIILGTLPIKLPGMSQAGRLGIAAGAFLIAILTGHFGPKWKITTYTTASANKMIREIGLSLLLATIGLGAGASFPATFTANAGNWILSALLFTVVPALVTGLVARWAFKMNFYTICGLLSGAATSAPVLEFASDAYGSDQVSVSYATVFPFALFAQVLAAQLLILLGCA